MTPSDLALKTLKSKRPIRHSGEKSNNFRHGHALQGHKSGEYTAWCNMRARCRNKSRSDYSRYGGRGITICDRWYDSFTDFLQDMGQKPSKEHSIERKNNNGNYEPGNCVWATRIEQTNNRRSTRIIELNGESHTLSEWAKIKSMTCWTLHNRLKVGWSVERALTEPNLHSHYNRKQKE